MNHVREQILIILQASPSGLTAANLTHLIQPTPCMSTVSRALRELRWKGKVCYQEGSRAKNGRKIWADQRLKVNGPSTIVPCPNPGQDPALVVFQAKVPKPKKTKALSVPVQVLPKSSCFTTVTPDPNQETYMNMEDAVAAVLKDFVAANKTFSAHDVTKEIRERANTGKITIDSVQDTIRVGAATLLRIEHNDVKDEVVKLVAAGACPNYARVHNGVFFEYGPVTTLPADDDASDPTNPGSPPPTDGGSYDGTPTL